MEKKILEDIVLKRATKKLEEDCKKNPVEMFLAHITINDLKEKSKNWNDASLIKTVVTNGWCLDEIKKNALPDYIKAEYNAVFKAIDEIENLINEIE